MEISIVTFTCAQLMIAANAGHIASHYLRRDDRFHGTVMLVVAVVYAVAALASGIAAYTG